MSNRMLLFGTCFFFLASLTVFLACGEGRNPEPSLVTGDPCLCSFQCELHGTQAYYDCIEDFVSDGHECNDLAEAFCDSKGAPIGVVMCQTDCPSCNDVCALDFTQ